MTFDQLLELLDRLPNLLGTAAGIAAFAYARLAAKSGKQQLQRTQGTQDWQNTVLGRVVRLEALLEGRGPGKRRADTEPTIVPKEIP